MKLEEILPGLIAGKTAWRTSYKYISYVDGTRVYWWLDTTPESEGGRRFHVTVEHPMEPSGRVPKSVQPHELTLVDLERDDWEFGCYVAGARESRPGKELKPRESRPEEETEQTRIKELIVAARVRVDGSLRSASALAFAVDSAGGVAPYFVAPLEVIGDDKSVERAILGKIRDVGLFGDRDERDVRVRYWETNVKQKGLVKNCPTPLRSLGVIR